jgi:hypothetical protein
MNVCANIRNKYKNLKTEQPNPYPAMLETLDDKYMDKLSRVVAAYPAYYAGVHNDYMKQLSSLNGVTKQIEHVKGQVMKSIQSYARAIEVGNSDIETMKRIQENLKTNTDYETLDTTTKQMLKDVSTSYNEALFMLWSKIGVLVLVLLQALKEHLYGGVMAGIAAVVATWFVKYLKNPYKNDPAG